MTITTSNYGADFRQWDVICKWPSGYEIVTAIEKKDHFTTLTTHPLTLSKWKWRRKRQVKMLRKILNLPTNDK